MSTLTISGMSRRERFTAAIGGQPVDQMPSTVWLHLASEHLSGEDVADLHLRYQAEYGWDFCKVMNDYRYPFPADVQELENKSQLRKFEIDDLSSKKFTEQLKCLRVLKKEMPSDVPIVETLFEPLQQILRKSGFDRENLLFSNLEDTKEMLENVTRTLESYIERLRDVGVDGIFYTVNGANPEGVSRGVSDDIFSELIRPFDLRILNAAEGMVRVIHAHGAHLKFSRILDYPCEAISWSDRFDSNLSLSEVRALTDKTLIGGISEVNIVERSRPSLTAEITDAYNQVGLDKFILSAGCAVASSCPQGLLTHIRHTASTFKGMTN